MQMAGFSDSDWASFNGTVQNNDKSQRKLPGAGNISRRTMITIVSLFR